MVKTLSRTIADDTNELPGDAPKPIIRKPGFRTQKEAKDAGLFELGEFARHGFEYETYKCDGRWFWRKHDEVKPPTADRLTNFEAKVNGGKRALAALTEKSKVRIVQVVLELPEDQAHALAALAKRLTFEDVQRLTGNPVEHDKAEIAINKLGVALKAAVARP